jgi:hypothetical protein
MIPTQLQQFVPSTDQLLPSDKPTYSMLQLAIELGRMALEKLNRVKLDQNSEENRQTLFFICENAFHILFSNLYHLASKSKDPTILDSNTRESLSILIEDLRATKPKENSFLYKSICVLPDPKDIRY